jgi:hypothetical protein
VPENIEIYMALPGQKLEDSQMAVSHDIDTRDDAKYDAEQRCSQNPALAKVVYYVTSDSGDFKTFFSYSNPNAKAAPVTADRAVKKKKKANKKPVKKTMWKKFRSVFEV